MKMMTKEEAKALFEKTCPEETAEMKTGGAHRLYASCTWAGWVKALIATGQLPYKKTPSSIALKQ